MKPIIDGAIDAGLLLLEMTYFPGGYDLTHQDIAFVCGCSEANIRQIEKNGLKKLKKAFEDKLQTMSNIDLQSELTQKRWAVISFNRVLGSGLTYAEAQAIVNKYPKHDPSLVIVTTEAANRVASKQTTDVSE